MQCRLWAPSLLANVPDQFVATTNVHVLMFVFSFAASDTDSGYALLPLPFLHASVENVDFCDEFQKAIILVKIAVVLALKLSAVPTFMSIGR